MAHKKKDGISRRDFMKITGAGALAVTASSGPFLLFPQRAAAQQKTLTILQWSHFVPAYDQWFDNIFAKQWGEKHDTKVTVDHITLTEIPARAAAEVSAKRGHDLVMFLEPTSAYEQQVIDHSEIYQEVEKKWSKPVDLAIRSTYDPNSKKYFAFSDSYVPDPGNYARTFGGKLGIPTARLLGISYSTVPARFAKRPGTPAVSACHRNSIPVWPCAP